MRSPPSRFRIESSATTRTMWAMSGRPRRSPSGNFRKAGWWRLDSRRIEAGERPRFLALARTEGCRWSSMGTRSSSVSARTRVSTTGPRSADDVHQAAGFPREFDFPRDSPARGHAGFRKLGIRAPANEQVRPRHDARADLEDLELQVVLDDCLQTERSDHPAEQVQGPFDDALPHVERRGQQALPQDDGRVPGDDERRIEAELPQALLGPELVHLVDVRLVPPVHSEHLQGALREAEPLLDDRAVEEVDVVPSPDDVLLDRVLHPGLDRGPEFLLVLRDERAPPALRAVVLHEHGAVDVLRPLDLPGHVDPRGRQPLPPLLPLRPPFQDVAVPERRVR